jgi:DNA-binding LacI/PurR family transcriptional regulator
MADVAREAGVSPTLVSRAFKGSYGVGDGTRGRIMEAAKRMGYEPNAVASRLASKDNRTMGVFLLDLHNEAYVDMYDGIRETAANHARELVIATGSISGDFGRAALDSLVRTRVDVAIAAGLLIPDAVMEGFRGRLKLVSITRKVEGFDAVYSDDWHGATLAVKQLIAHGHRKIVHLTPPPQDGYGGRLRGYVDTMRQAGLSPRAITCDFGRAAATAATLALLESGDVPTAVFANNDQSALGVLDALHVRGLRVPEDISVVGYDNTSASQPPMINMTTVDIHAVELGRLAGDLAIRRSENPDSDPVVVTSKPTLIVRGSTGPAPGSQ